MMTPDKVILIRHGETVWNQEGRFLGQSNPGLNETGQIQVRAAADILIKQKIDRLYSSDMLRAVETSQIIAEGHKVSVQEMSLLREIDFGMWEGLTFEQIQNSYPAVVNKWLKNPFEVRIPGGETAEEVWKRVIKSWEIISTDTSGGETVAIVAHGGTLRFLLCRLTGIEPARQWKFIIGHGEIIILQKTGNIYSRLNSK